VEEDVLYLVGCDVVSCDVEYVLCVPLEFDQRIWPKAELAGVVRSRGFRGWG
jgi:hypothetical protein